MANFYSVPAPVSESTALETSNEAEASQDNHAETTAANALPVTTPAPESASLDVDATESSQCSGETTKAANTVPVTAPASESIAFEVSNDVEVSSDEKLRVL